MLLGTEGTSVTEGPCFGKPGLARPTGTPSLSHPCDLREGACEKATSRESASGRSGQVCDFRSASVPSSKDLAVGRVRKSEGQERWEKVVLLGMHRDRTLAGERVP